MTFSRRALGRGAALLLLVAGLGCNRPPFGAKGFVASETGAEAETAAEADPDGYTLGTWSSVPDACSRDPFDGRRAGESRSVVTFLWEDPRLHDPHHQRHRVAASDAPMRLEVARTETGYTAGLTTLKTAGTLIRTEDCRQFSVETREEPSSVDGTPAAIGGRLRMDCISRGSRVTADLRFSGCFY